MLQDDIDENEETMREAGSLTRFCETPAAEPMYPEAKCGHVPWLFEAGMDIYIYIYICILID